MRARHFRASLSVGEAGNKRDWENLTCSQVLKKRPYRMEANEEGMPSESMWSDKLVKVVRKVCGHT
jgi:hypothetical protein